MYPSTHALTVYNALSLSGRDMPADLIHDYVRDHGYTSAERSDIDVGVEFLVQRQFVTVTNGVVTVARRKPETGAAWPLVRANDDQELVYR